MQDITSAGKAAFNPNNGEGGREIFYEVEFKIINNEAQSEAEETLTEEISISRGGVLTNDGIPTDSQRRRRRSSSRESSNTLHPMKTEREIGAYYKVCR